MKRPAFQFYPADWRKDVELGACGYVARGIWFEMLCIMHEAQPYGHMVRDGRPIPDQAAANLVRAPLKAYRDALKELEENGVLSRTAEGVIFSRRMVKDERLRNVRADCGQLGAEHGPKGAGHGSKGGRPRKSAPVDNSHNKHANNPANNPPSQEISGVTETGQKPPPSSSSSSSSSNGVQRTNEDASARDPKHPPGEISPKVNGKGHGANPPSGWHRTPEGIDAAGKSIGLEAKRGEDYDAYKQRIFAALEQRKQPH